MVKLSCVGSIGLSFIGTLRATQIRHDCKSRRHKGRNTEKVWRKELMRWILERGQGGGDGGGGVNDGERRDRK